MADPLREDATRFAQNAAAHLAAAQQQVAARQSAANEAEQQAATATAAHHAAATALAEHEHAITRWEAARINSTIFRKKGELFALTTTLEDLNATVASLQGQADGPTDVLNQSLQEKADLESRAASLQQEIDAESARHRALLPPP